MWLLCCTCDRDRDFRKSSITSQQLHCDSLGQVRTVTEKPRSSFDVHLIQHTPATNMTAGGVKRQRYSLPDVKQHSSRLVAPPTRLNTNESIAFTRLDCETGRRPTLELESTAMLATVESETDLESCAQSRSKSIQYEGIKRLSRQDEEEERVTRSSFSWIRPGSWRKVDSPKVKRRNRFSSLHKHFNFSRKKPGKTAKSKRSESMPGGQRRSDAFGGKTELDKSKRDKTVKETDVETDQESSSGAGQDKVGQLPPTWQTKKSYVGSSQFPLSLSQAKSDLASSNPSLFYRRQMATGSGSKLIALNDSINTSSSKPPGLRRASVCIFSQVDEPIVTPFAQVLASLRKVRNNFIILTNVTSSKDSHFGKSGGAIGGGEDINLGPMTTEHLKLVASETLDELEWCLDRLENIQTHRSVSDMASSKFTKMLNKELSQFAEGGQGGRQISDYIFSTFVDAKESSSGGENGSPSATTSPTDQLHSISSPPIELGQLSATGDEVFSTSSSGGDGVSKVADQTRTEKLSGEDHRSAALSVGSESGHNVTFAEQPKEGDGDGHPLLPVSQIKSKDPDQVVKKRGLLTRFNLPEAALLRCIDIVECKYNDNPYHNRLHAADVVHSTHLLLGANALVNVFTDLEVLAVLFACAVHDVDHPGVTNQYLINTNNQLAILYNDTSVLENHHLAVAFSALSQPNCDFLVNLPRKQRLSFRRMVIDMVLATDMSKHMSLLADLKTMVETKRVAGSGILTLDNYNDRMQILQNMIHCADLGNPAKPLQLYRQWNDRVMEEMFRQGDKEREQDLDISPMCDRQTASIEKNQVSFIDYIAHPLWETWSELVHPDARNILETLEENREWYQCQINEQASSS